MAETFAATYAKAIDDLAGKIFIPGVIASLLVEFGPWYQGVYDAGLIETYVVCAITGCMLSALIIFVVFLGSVYLFKGRDISPLIAVLIMPLGFAGLFPHHFSGFDVLYSQVTGVAILAWSFMLLSKGVYGVIDD